MEVVASAVRCGSELFPAERRAHSRLRQSVIDQNPALQERELLKLAGLATTLTDALRARGVDDPAATLAAHSGVTVFGIAFGQWLRDGEARPLAEIAAAVLDDLRNLG